MKRIVVLSFVVAFTSGLHAQSVGYEAEETGIVSSYETLGISSGTISGEVWEDQNGNGTRDPNELGLAGWTVYLNTGQTTVTDSEGQYGFANLALKSYQVSTESRSAWFQTVPSNSAQSSHPYSWTETFQAQSEGLAECTLLETDSDGDVLCAGSFQGSVDLDPSAGIDLRTAKGDRDLFVARFHANGSRAWAHVLGGAHEDSVWDMQIDRSGNVILVGDFASTVDFNPGEGTDLRTAAGMHDGFIMRLGADGSYGGTQVVGGNEATVTIRGLCLDPEGNLYLTGSFTETVDFDPGIGEDRRKAPDNYIAEFLTKLNADGSYAWTRTLGARSCYAYGMKVRASRQGEITVAGRFNSYMDVDFDPGPGTDIQDCHGDCDIFITRFDTQGTYLWTRTMGGAGWDMPNDLCLDASGNLYLTGTFSIYVDFDPGEGQDIRYSPHQHVGTCFVTRLDSNGGYGWTTTLGDEALSAGTAVRVDPLGYITVVGERLIPGISSDGTLRSDVFLSELNSNGRVLWTHEWLSVVEGTIVDTGITVYYPLSWAAALTANGGILLSGRFNGLVDFDPGVATDIRSGDGIFDAFVTKLARLPGVQTVNIQTTGTAGGVNFGQVQPADLATNGSR